MKKTTVLPIIAWSLAFEVCLLAVLAWGINYRWQVWPFSSYVWFPLLGLLAFSLMWAHYILGTIRDLAGTAESVLKPYYRYTGYAVLILVCLHPSLLIYQLFVDGAGLPPASYKNYVAPGLGWITLLGTASLLVFLAFELHRWLGKKSWWRYVVDASDFAMLAIVYHGFRLGADLQQGWYRWLWWFYAATLVAVLARKYWLRLMPKAKAGPA